MITLLVYYTEVDETLFTCSFILVDGFFHRPVAPVVQLVTSEHSGVGT